MAVAFAYTRQSKARNEDEGDSLSTAMQEHQIRQWAQSHGYEVSRVYEDQDISGRTANRPAFRQMLDDVETARDVAAVITYKYSRFARNVRVFANAHGQLQDRGVALLSATESGDTRMVQVSALMADWYSTDLSEFVSAALKQKARRGGWHGFLPFGYTKDVATQRLIVEPVEAALVADIFERFAGGESIASIADAIHGDPALAELRERRTWTYHTIARMLTKRVYLGHTSGMEHAHPAIVDPAVWDAVQALRRRPARYQRKAITSPLQGLVTCGACGERVHLVTVRRNRHSGNVYERYWKCRSIRLASERRVTVAPHQQHVRADWIEDAVRAALARDLSALVPLPDAVARARHEAHSDATDKRRAALVRQRAKAQDGRERLLTLFRDGRLDADRWEDADREAAAQVARIDADLATLPAPPDVAAYQDAARTLHDLGAMVGITADAAEVQAELDTGLRRLLLAIGVQVVIDARPPRRGRAWIAPSVTITYGEPYGRFIVPR